MLNYITWDVKPQIIDFGSFEIRWYSVLFAAGFVLGYVILSRIFKKEGLSIEILDKFTIYVVVGTIVGARLGHCLFYEPEYYLQNPLEMILPVKFDPFRITGFQGLASHGGAIGIMLALYFFARKYKKHYLWVLDRMAIVTALGGAFIRLGNLMNSEIYGEQTSLPWGFKFMRERFYGVPAEEIVPKHPTQLYEAISYLIVFFLLRYLYYKNDGKVKHGLLIGTFMITVFTARFFIEFIKENQVAFESGMILNMGQWLSIPFVLSGLFILYYSSRQKTDMA
ncbi:MAG: prolipoprotein diacylglyceryl transferase [Bacteroidetes bacterium]|nr:prolipoprotein diacylglyceryl transferase [Bacteroidota bacterium]